MRAVVLYESLTGNTEKAGEMIGEHLRSGGIDVVGFSPLKAIDFQGLHQADLVVVGTWVHGAFVVGQSPWAAGRLQSLPAMTGKQVAVYCTYALHPGKTVKKMMRLVGMSGGSMLGGVALRRDKLPEHTEDFAARVLDAVRL
jgi:flavodoxin